MAKETNWLEQLNRYIVPIVVVGIGIYGTWDLIVQPLIPVDTPSTACSTTVVAVTVLKPSADPSQPPQPVTVTEGLPIVVPAGETRLIEVEIENPDEQSAMYQWKATYGAMESRVSVGNRMVYTAPRSLVDDTITVEASLQRCIPAKRTLTFAIVPSNKVPLEAPTVLPSLPSPQPTAPSSLPTVDPFAPPAPR